MAAARDEATHGESRAENQYDTRALEASYLAAGQGRRMQSLQRLLGWARQQTDAEHDRAVQGALIRLRDPDDSPRMVLLAPEGGKRLSVEDTVVELVSMRSPLGQALASLEEGDAAEFDGPTGVIEWSIEHIS